MQTFFHPSTTDAFSAGRGASLLAFAVARVHLVSRGWPKTRGRMALLGAVLLAVLLGWAPFAAQAAPLRSVPKIDTDTATGTPPTSVTGAGTLSFAPKVDTATGVGPRAVVSGDFNGDGKADLATANQNASTLSVLLGVGDGTFTLKSSPATGESPESVTSADFNGDGKADLATANYNASTVSVLLGAGDGTFTLKSSPATGASPISVTSGDFNGDGKADLATANPGTSTLSVFVGVGDGTFTPKSTPATGTSPESVTSADFNGDGKRDLVTANYSAGTVSVLLGVGDGTFTLKSSPATGGGPILVTSGDFNGDGKADLATANLNASTLSVLLGAGDGTFTLKSTPTTGGGPYWVTSGDFDGDGKADLATANISDSTVSVLLGAGDGTFTLKSSPATGASPISVTSGDFNGDGKADLATANIGASTVSVLLNNSTLSPTVTTGTASTISATSATLSGTVNPNGAATTAQFQYGTTTAYGSTATVTLSPTNGTTAQTVSATISGLTPDTLYHFRISATNSNGTTNSADATFTTSEASLLAVTTTSDVVSSSDGVTSLREAITFANTHAGADTITFALPGTGVRTIQLTTSLPTLTDNATTIDGTTQSGASANTLATGSNAVLLVQIRGKDTTGTTDSNSFVISAANCTVRGLSISNTFYGVLLSGTSATGNKITGNFIGTNAAGTSALRNYYGVYIDGAPGNTIGGTTPGERNIISGCAYGGVTISGVASTGNKVSGNYIGTDATGTAVLGNGNDGVLIMSSPGNTIGGTSAGERNLISGSTGSGVEIYGAESTGNKVSGNYIGTDAMGTAALINSNGVFINKASNNTIGGTSAGERNLISGNNNSGVYIYDIPTTGNKVIGNYIGTDATGTAALPNPNGVYIELASGNTIGGTSVGERNLISGNSNDGVFISTSSATGNTVSGNYIGITADGTAALANRSGVEIAGASGNTVGGTTAGAGNLISGNTFYGVIISSTDSTGDKVTGNTIGTNAAGTAALPNLDGVYINSALGNTIGGTGVGAGNFISGNSSTGVVVAGNSSAGNRVRGNSIYANGTTAAHLGIDLVGKAGVNANDTSDGDTGPNSLQNYPVLTSSTSSGNTTTIAGTLNSVASTSFTLDFYSSPVADTSGYGEGQTFLGSTTVTTNSSGNVSFTASLPGVTVASSAVISATATDPNGNTSEFSLSLTSTFTPTTVGLKISEFRLSGPNGARDEYIELTNQTGSPINLTGYTLTAGTVTTALSGLNLSGKTIAAYGHLLIVNSGGYSLGTVYPSTYSGNTPPDGTSTGTANAVTSYATGDVTYTGDIALTSTLTLLNGATVVDSISNLSGAAGLVSTNQYAFVRRQDGAILVDTDSDTSDFNLVDTASNAGPPNNTGTSTLSGGARLGTPGPQNAASPLNRAALTLVPISIPGTIPEGRYVTKNSPVDPQGRLSLRRTITNNTNQTITQIRFTLVRTTSGTNTDTSIADLRALSSTGVLNAQGVRVVQGIQIEAPTTPVGLSASLSPATTGNGGGLNSSWNVGSLPAGGLAPGASMNIEFLFGIVRDGNYSTSVVATVAP